nr:MAG TPA: hypothetical protein [Caudoviricetes sp.]DAI47744.1 MAG TPA: hypothetical protein [Caudoviricetes sp.]
MQKVENSFGSLKNSCTFAVVRRLHKKTPRPELGTNLMK